MTEDIKYKTSSYSDDVHLIKKDNREFIIVGTAHISRQSADLVREVIEREKPDTVCVELDEKRLKALIANAGHVVGTERLLVHVWGRRGSGDRQLLKQLVHRRRHKIEADQVQPRFLQTESGAGYRLDVGTKR